MKTYVLDTCVILHDPKAPFKFTGNNVVIPLTVIEELDNFKTEQNSIGQNSRIFSRDIDDLIKDGDLTEGVYIEDFDLTIKVEKNHTEYFSPTDFEKKKRDNRILSVAKYFEDESDDPVILVSKDNNMRIKGHSIGLNVENYMNDVIELDTIYKGYDNIDVSSKDFIDEFFEKGYIEADRISGVSKIPNQMLNINFGSSSAIGIFKDDKIYRSEQNFNTLRISPKNREQVYALELLLDPDIKLVSLLGKAGSGKTILSLAAGLNQVVRRNIFEKMVILRPIVPLGNDIGYLPGDEAEKLAAWMRPIEDNLDYLLSNTSDSLIDEKIEKEALTYIRGRSIPDQFILLDEAQNTTPHEIKTILTRIGEGSKLILTGDPNQIDHPYLDRNTNGLTYVTEKMKNSKLTGSVLLTKGERSELAEEAADCL